MILMRRWNDAIGNRMVRDTPHQKGTRVPIFYDNEGDDSCRPQAFVVEQAPNWVLRQHYHGVHQFQVVSAGAGSIGRHQVAPLIVHYSSPESGYGPITAGPEGLSYYTLRANPDPQTRYLPESKPLMQKGLVRQHGMTPPIDPSGPATSSVSGATREGEPFVSLLQGHRDSAAVWRLDLRAGEVFEASRLPGRGPRYYLVAAGGLATGGGLLESGSVVFTHDEPGFSLAAGPDGLTVLAMQFPVEAVVG